MHSAPAEQLKPSRTVGRVGRTSSLIFFYVKNPDSQPRFPPNSFLDVCDSTRSRRGQKPVPSASHKAATGGSGLTVFFLLPQLPSANQLPVAPSSHLHSSLDRMHPSQGSRSAAGGSMRAFFTHHKILSGVIVVLLAAHVVRLIGPHVADSFSLTATHPRDWLEDAKEWWERHQHESNLRARQREIDAVTVNLPAVDEVVVYCLGDEDPTLTTGFPLPGSSALATIYSQHSLQSDDRRPWRRCGARASSVPSGTIVRCPTIGPLPTVYVFSPAVAWSWQRRSAGNWALAISTGLADRWSYFGIETFACLTTFAELLRRSQTST